MDSARRWLGLAYLFPAVLLAFGAASLNQGYVLSVGFLDCSPTSTVGCVDMLPFFLFEVGVFVVTAFFAYRAVKRARDPRKDLWATRVYWPIVLAAFGALALVAYAFASPQRGCDVGAWTPLYVLYGCWDPAVSLLRVALAGLLTAGFMTLVTRVPDWVSGTRAPTPKETESPAEPEATEEIPAR